MLSLLTLKLHLMAMSLLCNNLISYKSCEMKYFTSEM